MPIKIDSKLTSQKLVPAIERMFELSAQKILRIEKTWKPAEGTPVFTVQGRYTSRGWTEWTQGFQFGSALLQFDATGDERFLEMGRRGTLERMATHVSHIGVHDHGFNNVSTYGNLLRLMHEGRMAWNDREKDCYELALKVSGAVQAARWTKVHDATGGYIYSFNGPHSLFIDTMRTLRVLAVAHRLGHQLMGEHDEPISLLRRLLEHGETTQSFSVYRGHGRDGYDEQMGRVAHESIFNLNDGTYRCPNSQQGYSPFSTWTRGQAWAILGFAEELEFFRAIGDREIDVAGYFRGQEPKGRELEVTLKRLRKSSSVHPGDYYREVFLNAAQATADGYLACCCADGVPMWDTGAPNLHRLPSNYLSKAADPFNRFEPVDSSAAAIAAQGLIRLGNYLRSIDKTPRAARLTRHASRYRQAGLTIARTLLGEPYLSTKTKHQGLLLHSVYHRPNGWDYIAPRQNVPNGESSMWGDYHLRELALLILREAKGLPYLTFFGCVPS